MPGEKLVRTIKKASAEAKNSSAQTDLVFGEVTALVPLTIKVDNRFTITEEFIILSALCKEKVITFTSGSHSHPATEGSVSATEHTHTVQLWRGLVIGDRLRMIRASKGQMYYAIERGDEL